MRWDAAVDSSSRAAPALEARDLTFSYQEGEKPVFQGLDFSIARGEAVLLMGGSGCGKSTLAYCLAGLYPEHAGVLTGQVLAEGTPVREMGPAKRAKLLSMIFQNPDSQFCMDRPDHEVLFALENVNAPGDLLARAAELLELVGLTPWAQVPMAALSGGTKQRLALATALATGARILILDEPFANLDASSRADLLQLLCRLRREQGLTLLVVDHRPDWWRGVVTRIERMDETGALAPCSLSPEQLEEHRQELTAQGLFLDDRWLEGRHPTGSPGPAPALRAENLTVFAGKEPLLRGLNFQVPKGSVTALIGPSAAGKTTLLLALAGVGKIQGHLEKEEPVGLVFQDPRFQFLSLTAEEEVMTTLRIASSKQGEEERKKQAEALLEEFGLLQWRKASPYALSQGQQRRLALLSMLAGNQTLLLLDEPTYAQDQRSSQFILELLERRVAAGLTVIMATHDLALARACAHQILLLKEGRLTLVTAEQLPLEEERRTAICGG